MPDSRAELLQIISRIDQNTAALRHVLETSTDEHAKKRAAEMISEFKWDLERAEKLLDDRA